jgi:hypothetical protein
MDVTQILAASPTLSECLRRLAALELPDWALGAGCIAQTVWNATHGKAPDEDILDYDLVYFDPEASAAAEARIAERARSLLADLSVAVDVKNQARVHRWYARRFGFAIEPYRSTADAIATWPSTATAIGVRSGGPRLEVIAPFGTADLLCGVVRANRVQITREVYAAKVARWAARWPRLDVRPWEEGVGVEGARRWRGAEVST